MAIPKSKGGGGPRTAGGKAVVSGNAVKAGAYSRLHLLPDEDPTDYQQLADQFQSDFAPQDVAEAAMVHDLVGLTWKMIRVNNYQHDILLRRLDANVKAYELNRDGNFPCSDKYFEYAELVWDHDIEAIHHDQGVFLKVMSKLGDVPTHELLRELKKKCPDYFDELVERFSEGSDLTLPTGDLDMALADAEVTIPGGVRVSYLKYFFDDHADHRDKIDWAYECRNEIRAAYRAVKATRAMDFMQSAGESRVTDDLQRAFHKTLGELRRHQNWRRSLKVLDITPALPDPGTPRSH